MPMQRTLPLYDGPSIARRVALAAVVAAILGLIGWRVIVVRMPPPLALVSPAATLHATASRIITVAGSTEPGAGITINGAPFVPDPAGGFAADIVLLPGVNTITIEARRPHSRPARIERTIRVRANDAPLAQQG